MARSLRSTTRRQEMLRGSISRALPCMRWVSTMAASRLLAVPTAWMSPVKWRLMSSIGTTCEYPPPAAPPLMPKTGPVSYTHLRAHETRHDLVCRLLLEKKKNIKHDCNTYTQYHKQNIKKKQNHIHR